MAPLFHLIALFALATTVLASPHVSRNVYNHAHRAIVHPAIEIDSPSSPPLPRRKRSLNRRCVPRPANSTTSSLPPTSTAAPINVAPLPSLPTSSAPPPPPPSSSPAHAASSSPPPTSYPPSSSHTTSTSTSSTPPPAQTSASSSSSGEPSYMIGTQSGQGTFYSTGLGACGITNNDSQYIAAVSYLLFDSYPGYDGVNPNTNPVCGKTVTATYQGKPVTVTITDRCTGCQLTDLDFSPSAFDTLADPSLGRINLNWVWA